MSTGPQLTPPDPSEPHPLDLVREQAAHTTVSAVRAELDALSEQHAELSRSVGWAANAEEEYREVIGIERKAQLEMRVGLGAEGAKFVRRTAPLAEMSLPELQEEYRTGRRTTLALIDALLLHPESRAWTLGEEVAPEIYIVSLRNRLKRWGEGLAEVRA